MPCRIGISTNPDARRAYWETQYYGFKNWEILAGPFYTKAGAQKRENDLAAKYGCLSHPGGADPDDAKAVWYVYAFDYSSKR